MLLNFTLSLILLISLANLLVGKAETVRAAV